MFRPIAIPIPGGTLLLSVLLLTMVPFGSARAALVVEPEIGVRAFTNDVADLFDPGISIGGVVGFSRTPRLLGIVHVDLSLHPATGDTSVHVERGVVVGMTLGGRFLPLGRDASRRAQPYLGVEAGLTSLSWSLTDTYAFNRNRPFETQEGLLGLTLGAEAGVTIRTASGLGLGLVARFRDHLWTDSNGLSPQEIFFSVGGARGFEGRELGLHLRLSLPFHD